MANSNPTEAIEAIASAIGSAVYIDVAKWHLYLNDAKLHTLVAQRLYPLLVDHDISEDRVLEVLGQIPVKVGGGTRELSLLDLLPIHCQVDLMDVLEELQRQL
jgi:hypothetical protein